MSYLVRSLVGGCKGGAVITVDKLVGVGQEGGRLIFCCNAFDVSRILVCQHLDSKLLTAGGANYPRPSYCIPAYFKFPPA